MASNAISSLLEKARTGDQIAFEEALGKYEDELVRAVSNKLRSINGTDNDSADILQKTRLKAWNAIGSGKFRYESDPKFGGWLIMIAMNCILDSKRDKTLRLSQLPTLEDGLNFDVANEQRSQLSALTHAERTTALQRIINQLPEEMSQVIQLRMLGWKYNDIAKALRTNAGTIRMRALRAEERLKNDPSVHRLCMEWSSIVFQAPDD
jgi:RNA polymerase sigma factor (sigma-70 family)